jgi:RNA-directed DNA polymerase
MKLTVRGHLLIGVLRLFYVAAPIRRFSGLPDTLTVADSNRAVARNGSMFEEASVNTGAVEWPDPDSAHVTVRRMQTKLHRWAVNDSGRRFGDLFNLVYDPAFLVVAWERLSTNKGAKTAGIDKVTAAQIVTRIGVGAFLEYVRGLLKSGEFQPVEVRRVMIPKG